MSTPFSSLTRRNRYTLRSCSVHGEHPRPSREEVDGRAAALEHFVGHLLSGPLLEAIKDE